MFMSNPRAAAHCGPLRELSGTLQTDSAEPRHRHSPAEDLGTAAPKPSQVSYGTCWAVWGTKGKKKNGLAVLCPTSLRGWSHMVTPCALSLSLALAPDPRATISSRTKSRRRYEHAFGSTLR